MSRTRIKGPVTRSGERPDIVLDKKILVLARVNISKCSLNGRQACFRIFQMTGLEYLSVTQDPRKSSHEVRLEKLCGKN
jgi:hypothetical protein